MNFHLEKLLHNLQTMPSDNSIEGIARCQEFDELVTRRFTSKSVWEEVIKKIREQGVYGDIGQREFTFNFRTRCYEQTYG